MEENGMARAPHPPSLPDLGPSDFCLFGYLKHCLRGQSFEAADGRFLAIEAIWGSIQKSTLDEVFLEQIERLRRFVGTNGQYFEEP
jgi:hypothetical protein